MLTVIERALLRSLRRQPTRRVDIYDEFEALYFEREVQKSMGQRGTNVAPQQMRLEVGLLPTLSHDFTSICCGHTFFLCQAKNDLCLSMGCLRIILVRPYLTLHHSILAKAVECAYQLYHAAPSFAHLTRTLFLDCALLMQAIEFARQLSVYMV